MIHMFLYPNQLQIYFLSVAVDIETGSLYSISTKIDSLRESGVNLLINDTEALNESIIDLKKMKIFDNLGTKFKESKELKSYLSDLNKIYSTDGDLVYKDKTNILTKVLGVLRCLSAFCANANLILSVPIIPFNLKIGYIIHTVVAIVIEKLLVNIIDTSERKKMHDQIYNEIIPSLEKIKNNTDDEKLISKIDSEIDRLKVKADELV